MIVTNKQDFTPVNLDAREIKNITEHCSYSTVQMKDGTVHVVDEKPYHLKSLMLVELTSNIMEAK